MKKLLKTIIILSVMTPLIFAPIFCCCLLDSAMAEEEMPSCHMTESADSASADHQDADSECECEDFLSALNKKVIKIQKSLSSDTFSDLNSDSTVQTLVTLPNFSTTILASQSPPSDCPPYLKYSILRL